MCQTISGNRLSLFIKILSTKQPIRSLQMQILRPTETDVEKKNIQSR